MADVDLDELYAAANGAAAAEADQQQDGDANMAEPEANDPADGGNDMTQQQLLEQLRCGAAAAVVGCSKWQFVIWHCCRCCRRCCLRAA